MAQGLAARLRASTAASRAACLAHPFVQGIADGSLPARVFSRWVTQDWRYLQTYVVVLARAAELAPTPEAAARWRDLHTLTLEHELDLHRAFAARFGLTPGDLDAATPLAATEAYTAFLRSATRYPLLVAALLPCGVGYVEIARALAARPAPADPRYADWIRTYDDAAFRDAVAWMEAELDASAGDDPDVPEVYAAGARHELHFWEALWQGGG
jgi:thiaminase/transcriptional activator TenA